MKKVVQNRSQSKSKLTSKMVLKPVGKPQKKFAILKRNLFEPERCGHGFDGEIVPSGQSEREALTAKTGKKRGFFRMMYKQSSFFINQQKQEQAPKFNLIEDPRESQFTYRKYLIIQKLLLILTIFYFFISVISTEMDIMQSKFEMGEDWQVSKHTNVMSSMITIFLMLLIFMRYVTVNQLAIDQKKYYCVRTSEGMLAEIGRFLRRRQLHLLLIQLLILMPHPIVFFHESIIQIFQSYNQLPLKHRLNDILTILSLLRSYIVVRSMINLTMYSTPRASRLCTSNQVEHSLLYSVKCLLKEEPLRFITLVFFVQVLTLGFGLKLSEGALTQTNPQIQPTGFENYINCYWCVFITMATVGYGDHYPKTLPGRIVGLCAAVSGIILSSLLIVSLMAYLTMQTNQSKSHLTLARLQHQSQLKQQATQAFIQTMKMTKYLASQQKQNDHKIKHFFTKLKEKIDIVKFRSRKIKSLVNTNNIIEEMNRLFELFKDNLQQSYSNQIILKDSLNTLTKNKSIQKKMKTIFLTHNMEEFITNKR